MRKEAWSLISLMAFYKKAVLQAVGGGGGAAPGNTISELCFPTRRISDFIVHANKLIHRQSK